LDFPLLIGIGAVTFVAINIDDLFVLMAFFASKKYPPLQIILWQLIGISTITAISIAASLIALVIPSNYVGLLGLLPIVLGIKELVELRNQENEELPTPRSALSFSGVAMIAIADGGDNIGIETPLFATYNTPFEIMTLVAVFLAMTVVWCGFAYYLVYHSALASRIQRVGKVALPFVLIGLGIYILVEAFLVL
jgi:cadmium resistance protein CadD (predicted permease)